MWRTKKQCKGTLQTLCDLSNETSDLGQMYFARWVRHLPEAHQSFCSDVHLTVNLINISMPKTDFKEEDSSHVPMLVPQEPEDHKTVVRRHFGYTVQSCVPRFAPVSCDSEFDSSGRCSPAWMGISEGSDYGIVVKAQRPEMENECKANSCSGDDFSQPMVDSVLQPSNVLTQEDCGGETPYRQQLQATQPSMCTQWNKVEEEEEPENSGSLLVDWDPKTGRLQIPTISALQLEPDLAEEERPECDQVKPSDILSNVYVRQSSEESTEYEDALKKMENNWDLQINMEKQYK
ncbi:hypothetical protein JZ751_005048 [Albula glossodonta]|uniref:Uncharacterized protein n=1 Tax=Albula glossodonta TaxID=121402 RepID=A0A8T2P8A5_9TELE|nr:hypothetical protein JZ751_005048 [Albula glossodonta]